MSEVGAADLNSSSLDDSGSIFNFSSVIPGRRLKENDDITGWSCGSMRKQKSTEPVSSGKQLWRGKKKCIIALIVTTLILLAIGCTTIVVLLLVQGNMDCKPEKVFVLLDKSSGSNQTLLEMQHAFVSKTLVKKLNETESCYNVPCYQYDKDLEDVFDPNDNDDYETSDFSATLNIGRTLETLYNKELIGDCNETKCTVVLFASGKGEDFLYALGRAKYLMDNGIELIVINLGEPNETVQQLASTTVSSEWLFFRPDSLLETAQPAIANVTIANIKHPQRVLPGMPAAGPFVKEVIILCDERANAEEMKKENDFVNGLINKLNDSYDDHPIMLYALNFTEASSGGELSFTQVNSGSSPNVVYDFNSGNSLSSESGSGLTVNVTGALMALHDNHLTKHPSGRTIIIILLAEVMQKTELTYVAGRVKHVINHGDHVMVVGFRKPFDQHGLRSIASCNNCVFDGIAAFHSSGSQALQNLTQNVHSRWKNIMKNCRQQPADSSGGGWTKQGPTLWPLSGMLLHIIQHYL